MLYMCVSINMIRGAGNGMTLNDLKQSHKELFLDMNIFDGGFDKNIVQTFKK